MTTPTLEHPADRDDSVSEMILTRRKRRLPVLTAILTIAAVIGGAFIGGAEIQKHYGTTATSGTGGAPSASALAARFRAAGGFPGGAGAAPLGAGTSGTVTLIKGSTLYVTDTSGTTVTVHTSAASQVTKAASGTIQAIHPGDTITVTGKQAKNGSYTASAITIASSGNG
jgi:hypothetical protein